MKKSVSQNYLKSKSTNFKQSFNFDNLTDEGSSSMALEVHLLPGYAIDLDNQDELTRKSHQKASVLPKNIQSLIALHFANARRLSINALLMFTFKLKLQHTLKQNTGLLISKVNILKTSSNTVITTLNNPETTFL